MDLEVTVISAQGLRNADGWISATSDPYCICQVAGPAGQTLRTSFSTKTVQDSEHPVWNETGQIQLESGDQHLEFQVWDKDQTKDELLGKAALNCRRLRLGKPLETNVKLTGVHAAGSVRVRVRVLKKHDTIFSQCCCGR